MSNHYRNLNYSILVSPSHTPLYIPKQADKTPPIHYVLLKLLYAVGISETKWPTSLPKNDLAGEITDIYNLNF